MEKTTKILKTVLLVEAVLIINIIAGWGIIRFLDYLFPTLGY